MNTITTFRRRTVAVAAEETGTGTALGEGGAALGEGGLILGEPTPSTAPAQPIANVAFTQLFASAQVQISWSNSGDPSSDVTVSCYYRDTFPNLIGSPAEVQAGDLGAVLEDQPVANTWYRPSVTADGVEYFGPDQQAG